MSLGEVQSGTLLLSTSEEGSYAPAPIQETRAEIRVTGPIAHALVTQRFRNPGDQWAEAVYAFLLPEDAAVDHMRMRVGERLIEGQIKERAEAREIYETAAAEGRRAGLVEQHRPNLFTTSVANIPPRGEIEVAIEYQQQLQWRDGEFSLRFPLAITPRYSPGSAGTLETNGAVAGGWSVLPGEIPNAAPLARPAEVPMQNPVTLLIDLDPGFALDRLQSRYHPIDSRVDEDEHTRVELQGGPIPADRDFVLEWTPKGEEEPTAAFFTEHTADGDYGLLMVMPPRSAFEGQRRLPREILFLADTSGSMGGESIRQVRDALALALERLQPQDRCDVIKFNSKTHALFPRPVDADPAHRDEALAFARGLGAAGGARRAGADRHGAGRDLLSGLAGSRPDPVAAGTRAAAGRELQAGGRLMAQSPGLRRTALALLILGVALAGHGSWIPVKALIAQQLLQRAWAETLDEGGRTAPGPGPTTGRSRASWPRARGST